MFEDVLGAIDLSNNAGAVTGLARELATKTGSEVRVLHLEEMGFAGRSARLPWKSVKSPRGHSRTPKGALKRPDLRPQARRAPPRVAGSRELAAEEAACGSSVISVGSPGHGGCDVGLVGSTANRLVHTASGPVLVVP